MDEPIYPFAKETGVESCFHVHTVKEKKEIVAHRLRAALEEGA